MTNNRSPGVHVFMDCGAPSLYNKLSRKTEGGGSTVMGAHIRNRRKDNFDYVKTEEYLAYRQDFVDFIKLNGHVIDTYPNLDVINNAELTYENQKWLEAQGLKPCPVWHLGSDKKWLERYLSEGYGYICVGGMVPNSKSVLRPALDRLWSDYLTDKEGMPIVKIHGFAMTSFDLMYRYPWYSVDSKSWIDIAKFGGVLLPPLKPGGGRDYLYPSKVMLTPRSVGSHASDHHYWTTTEGRRRGVLRYLEEVQVPFGKSELKAVELEYELLENEQWAVDPAKKKGPAQIPNLLRQHITPKKPGLVEVVLEMGASNTHYYRLDVNIQLYRKIEEIVPAWPWKLPRAIKRGKAGLLS